MGSAPKVRWFYLGVSLFGTSKSGYRACIMQVRYGDLGIAMELEWGADGPQPYTTWL